MKGAIVFIVVFVLGIVATLAYQDLPIGRQVYNALNLPVTDYQLLGIQVPTLVAAILNGVFYGIIVWIIYSLAERASKPKPSTPQETK
jgi:predicted secreted protein